MTVADLAVHTTSIPGLLVIDLPLHGDSRGWFKENWQRAKMVALGLPDFGPVQNNMSYNADAGRDPRAARRAVGQAHRPRPRPHPRRVGRPAPRRLSFGATFTLEMGTDKAVFVPRGVANGYQALEADTTYSYLVNDHWSPAARESYTYLNLADETAAIAWPIPLSEAIVSAADLAHPRLADVTPMAPRRTVITGATGQLGRALQAVLPDAVALGRDATWTSPTPRPSARTTWPAWARSSTPPPGRPWMPPRPTRAAATPGPATSPPWRTSSRPPARTAPPWCTSPPTTSSTAPSPSTPRRSPSARSASMG